ncbi:hypothetical protein M5G07_10550 [Serratia symbiotica]|nr:hypothetical protein [Serratia symbiotica]
MEETESFLSSALSRAEEKIENEKREIEHLRTQLEKLHRILFGTRSEKLRRQVEEAEAVLKLHEQAGDRHNGRKTTRKFPVSFASPGIVSHFPNTFRVR